jgi:fructokinase
MSSASTTSSPILCLGELLWDRLPSGDLLGGAPANVANRLRSLGECPYLVSRVGADAEGIRARDILTALGLSTEGIQIDNSLPTGFVDVTLNEHGDPHYVLHEGVAYDSLSYTPSLREVGSRAKAIVFGTLILRASEARRTAQAILHDSSCALKLLDINLRKNCYTQETIEESLYAATIVKINESEAKLLAPLLSLPDTSYRTFCTALASEYKLEAVLLTLGSQGVLATSPHHKDVMVPARTTKVVDTIGAGDAFTAGFTAAHLHGAPLEDACALGNLMGSLAASSSGGMGEIDTTEAIEMLRSRSLS